MQTTSKREDENTKLIIDDQETQIQEDLAVIAGISSWQATI